mgnify:CR=1 FL=1
MKLSSVKYLVVFLILLGLIGSVGFAKSKSPVLISEVAWSGTPASWADEWIELKNEGDEKIDLSGWVLAWEGEEIQLGKEKGDTISVRESVIEPGGTFLLERSDDGAVASVKADAIYKGALSNSGEKLVLTNAKGDKVHVLDASEGWMAGTASGGDPGYASMELVDGNWATHKSKGNQTDDEENHIYGTPGNTPKE